jgi:hypothetical protein
MVAHELLVPIPGRRRIWMWRLVLLSLHLLHSVGEVLDQLHLRFKELLHSWIHYLINRWRWCKVLLICNVSTDHRWYVLTSSGPGVYHLTVRKIYQKDTFESMHKKITKLNKQHVFQLGQILLTAKNQV